MGSKKGHANCSVETVPDDKDDGKHILTRVDLTYINASITAEAAMQPHRAQ